MLSFTLLLIIAIGDSDVAPFIMIIDILEYGAQHEAQLSAFLSPTLTSLLKIALNIRLDGGVVFPTEELILLENFIG